MQTATNAQIQQWLEEPPTYSNRVEARKAATIRLWLQTATQDDLYRLVMRAMEQDVAAVYEAVRSIR